MLATQTPQPPPSRFYVAPGKYLLPADDPEAVRLKDQNDLLRRLFDNKNVLSAIDLGPESQVLDIATGSGIWALDLVTEKPEIGHVQCADIGTRLFPKEHPPNMAFDVASVLDLPAEWSNKFDLVHQRLLIAALKYDDWAVAVKEIFRVTKPGGFAELCECNPFKVGCGPHSRRYLDGYREVAKHFSMDFEISHRIPGLLLEAGFVDVHAEVKVVNFGPAGGEDGRRTALTQAGVARGIGGPLTMAGGLGVVDSQDEWEALIDEVEKEWESEEGSNAEYYWFVFTARKPS
ncbi:hypothetical protein D9619_013019 [Psilocybe cf. subviscida]|uniref:Methyltransferase domain-containing protein n=1 Tax=Psilocybe cf. subviscida TaxID=2480587 RepID=A0A8H5AZE4_9AGAR|nr:hypothetical protein D9619_013019 [Psilocybe cf. subviscida]